MHLLYCCLLFQTVFSGENSPSSPTQTGRTVLVVSSDNVELTADYDSLLESGTFRTILNSDIAQENSTNQIQSTLLNQSQLHLLIRCLTTIRKKKEQGKAPLPSLRAKLSQNLPSLEELIQFTNFVDFVEIPLLLAAGLQVIEHRLMQLSITNLDHFLSKLNANDSVRKKIIESLQSKIQLVSDEDFELSDRDKIALYGPQKAKKWFQITKTRRKK